MRSAPALLVAASLLGACAGPASQRVVAERTQHNRSQIEQLLAPPTSAANAVSYTDRSWIALRKVDRPARDAATERTDALQIEIHQRFQNLNEIAGTLTALTGWPVLVAADVPAAATAATPAAAPVGAPAPLAPVLLPLLAPVLAPVSTLLERRASPGSAAMRKVRDSSR